MKNQTWVLAVAGTLAVVAVLGWAFAPRAQAVETANASVGVFEATVEEDGKTLLRDRYLVSAPLAGLLARSPLREGDSVAAGAVVATLTPLLPTLTDARTLREQQLQVQIAQAQVLRAQARLEGAQVALMQTRNEAQRSEQLVGQGFVSRTKLDNDRLTNQAAQKELEAATQERRIATHDVEQAKAALQAVQHAGAAGGSGFSVRAPVAGRVLRVLQASESTVALGTPLLELGNVAQLEVVAELLTTDALLVKPGSAVVVERWGGNGELRGRVRMVEPGGFTKVSALGVEEQRVKVHIDIETPHEQWQALGDGYRVSVRIVTLRREQALQVPVSAVFSRADATGMAVLVVEGGRAWLRPVQLGGRNGSSAWLTGGLQAGEQVIVYPPATVKDGSRVTRREV